MTDMYGIDGANSIGGDYGVGGNYNTQDPGYIQDDPGFSPVSEFSSTSVSLSSPVNAPKPVIVPDSSGEEDGNFGDIDANHDGKISMEEITGFSKNNVIKNYTGQA